MSEFDDEVPLALRVFGDQLKHWRALAGWTQEEFGRQVGYSAEMIASIEQGRRGARPEFYELADEALNARGSIRAARKHLVMKVKGDAAKEELAQVERQAVCLYFYEAMAIPALLHTKAYALAVLGAFSPTLDEDRLDLAVTTHLERAAVLDRKPPVRLGFVIDESALRRPLGGWTVLGGQLARIAEIARRGNVTVQVMPMDCEDNAGINGSIALLETAQRQLVAHVAYAGGGHWVTRTTDVSVLHQQYGVIRAQAMTTRDSLDLIEKLLADHGAVDTG